MSCVCVSQMSVVEECVAEEASTCFIGEPQSGRLTISDCKQDVSFGKANGETGTGQNNMGSVHTL